MEDLYDAKPILRRFDCLRKVASQCTDLGIAVSPNLLDELRPTTINTVVERNGIDRGFLKKACQKINEVPAVLREIATPRLCVVGTQTSLNVRLDHQFLAKLAALLSDWQIVIVGCNEPNQSLRQLCELPNIHLLGMQGHDTLCEIIGSCQVCAIPYKSGAPKRDTLKAYEYLACGKPVVVTVDDLHPSLQRFSVKAPDPEQFATACRNFLAAPLDIESVNRDLDCLVWENRLDRCLAQIELLSNEPRLGRPLANALENSTDGIR